MTPLDFLFLTVALTLLLSTIYVVWALAKSREDPDPLEQVLADDAAYRDRLDRESAMVSASLHDGVDPGYPYPPRPTSAFDGPGQHAGGSGKVTFLHGRPGL